MNKKIKKIVLLISFLILSGCGGTILDDSALDTNSIQIQGITVTSESSTVSIIWTTNTASTHKIIYGTASGSYTLSTIESISETTTHQVDISGLQTDQEYYFKIICNSNGYDTLESGEFSFTTSSTINVTLLTAELITENTSVISWTTNVATTHIVEYGTASGTYTQSTMQSSASSLNHAVTLSGLTSGTEYFYRVKNFHSTLPFISSTGLSFTTLAEPVPTLAQRLRGIWVLGGLSAQNMAVTSNTIGAVDMYDPVTGIWYPAITTLPTPVSFAASVGYEGKIYVMGGFNNLGAPVGLTQIYNVATGIWSTGASMSNVRSNHSAVVINGKIYITRGTTGTYNTAWAVAGTPLNTLIYTISSNSWSSTGITDSAVSNKSSVALGDIVYYLGGKSATSTLVNTFDGISTSTNSLTSGITELVLSSARVGFSSVVYTDSYGAFNIVVIGGFTLITNATGNYVFNTVTAATPQNLFQYIRSPFIAPSSWLNASNTLPASIGFGSAVKSGSMLYYFGGTSYPVNALNFMYSFNLDSFPSGSWTDMTGSTPMPRARFGHTAVTVE